MRVAQGITRILPDGKSAPPRDSTLRPGSSPDGDLRDTVQISAEARDLHEGRSRGVDSVSGAGGLEGARLAQIEQRMESGFYDLPETRMALADEVLGVFGL